MKVISIASSGTARIERQRRLLPFPLILAVVALVHPTRASNETLGQADLFDQLTAWKHCSLGSKEWSICFQPTGWGPLWYCPTVDESVNPAIGASAALEDKLWYGIQMNFTPCFTCPVDGSDCESIVAELVELHNLTFSTIGPPYYDLRKDGLQMCIDLCESGRDGDACSSELRCTAGSHFCDLPGEGGDGTCRGCPADVNDCYGEKFPDLSDLARRECMKCRLVCYDVGNSSLVVEEEELESGPIGQALQEPKLSGSGPLVDCSDLILADVDFCPNANGSICLVYDRTLDTLFYDLSNKAEQNGCVAVVKFTDDLAIRVGHHWHDQLAIPFVEAGSEVGTYLMEKKLGTLARVQSELWGSACYPSWDLSMCSDEMPCLDSIYSSGVGGIREVKGEDTYCNFNSVVRESVYLEGMCTACPTGLDGELDPAGCFFTSDSNREGVFYPKNQKEVESCAKSCNAALNFGDCKFCPSGMYNSFFLPFIYHFFFLSFCVFLYCRCICIRVRG